MKLYIKRLNFTEQVQNKAILLITYLLAFIIFIDPGRAIIWGPLLAFAILVSFRRDVFVYIAPLIILGNDALQTVAFNRGSFAWYYFALIVLRIISKRHISISKKRIALFLLSLIFVINYVCFLTYTNRELLELPVYLIICLYSFFEIETNKEKMHMFLQFTLFVIILETVHLIFFGGVEYMTYGQNEWLGIEGTYRYGMLGTGRGDPNYSALKLCFGLAIALAQTSITKILRWFSIVCCVVGLIRTLSMTGLIGGFIILLGYVFFTPSLPKKIKIVVLSIVIGGMILILYIGGYIQIQNLEEYISRIVEKIHQFMVGDLSGATTNRSSNLENNWNYFWGQSGIGILFGGNHLPPGNLTGLSHNTYMDMLLRFGIIGCFLLGVLLIYNLQKAIKRLKRYKGEDEMTIVLIKIVQLYFCCTLSIYSSHPYAFMCLILFFM